MRDFLDYYDQLVTSLTAAGEPPSPDDLLQRLAGVPSCVDIPKRSVQPGKLNIALICREYPPETAFGGMATFSQNLARGLVEAGHRVTVISVGVPAIHHDIGGSVTVVRIEPTLRGSDHSFEELHRRGWIGYPRAVLAFGLGALLALRRISGAAGAFDVLDLADHGAEGLIPALFADTPATVRLYSPFALFLAMRPRLASESDTKDIAILESALLERGGVVTSPSVDLAARVKTFFGLTRPISLVPNPVDTEMFRPPAESATARGHHEVRVCFVGRLERRKGIETLLQAIPTVLNAAPSVRFEIVGRDHLGFRGRAGLSLWHRRRVEFRDPVPLTELAAVYQRSDISVVPSLYDNSPYTCIEPMACGIPVIGTTVGGIGEYVVEGRTGFLIQPRDPDALAAAIIRLAADAELRHRLGVAAREHAVGRFSNAQVAAMMVAEYRRAIEIDETNDLAATRGSSDPEVTAGAQPGIGGNGLPGAAPGVNRVRPELSRVEALIVDAGVGGGTELDRTIADALAEAPDVTVIWSGPRRPAIAGVHVVDSVGTVGTDAARFLSTVLDDAVALVRVGDRLPVGVLDRARCAMAATGVSAIVVDGLPVFSARVTRGSDLSDCATWGQVVQRLLEYAQQHPDGARTADYVARGEAVPRPLHTVLWSGRLRPYRQLARRALSSSPRGRRMVRHLERIGPFWTAAAINARGRRSPGPVTVVSTRSDSHASAFDGASEPELWVLDELAPPARWQYVISYLKRTRAGRVSVTADVAGEAGQPPPEPRPTEMRSVWESSGKSRNGSPKGRPISDDWSAARRMHIRDL